MDVNAPWQVDGVGAAVAVHVCPFQCSISGPPVVVGENQVPTAVTSVAEKARTLASVPPFAPGGSGTVVRPQAVPFHTKTRGSVALTKLPPTAQACAGDAAATPLSCSNRPIRGMGDTVNAPPLECSIRLCSGPTWSSVYPAAQNWPVPGTRVTAARKFLYAFGLALDSTCHPAASAVAANTTTHTNDAATTPSIRRDISSPPQSPPIPMPVWHGSGQCATPGGAFAYAARRSWAE